MWLDLPYAHPGLSGCEVPGGRLAAVYRLRPQPALADLPRAIEGALARPTGAPALRDLPLAGKRVALLVDDLTRPTPAHAILPPLLAALREAGVRSEQVGIVLAVGSHREMTPAEIRRKLGEDAVAACRATNSQFRDRARQRYVGTTEDGVPIWIDAEAAEADVRIGVGSIVPHGAVGWSGGGKIVYPGVAGEETVMRFHFVHGLTEANMTGVEECPIRLRMEAWVDRVGLDFVVNSVLLPDGQAAGVVAGHYREAQRAGVRLARRIYSHPIRERVDILLSVAYPHDLDFWQAAKGIYGPERLLEDGGTLLLVAPCPEGVGTHPDFLERIGRDDNPELLRRILAGGPAPPDPIPLAPGAMMARMRHRFRCAVVSPGLTRAQIAAAGYEAFPDVQSGLDCLLQRYPQGRVAVVLHSDLTFG